jgi:hypothetical protein
MLQLMVFVMADVYICRLLLLLISTTHLPTNVLEQTAAQAVPEGLCKQPTSASREESVGLEGG